MIAFSSAIEVVNQIIIAHDLDFISEPEMIDFKDKLAKLTNKIERLS